MFAESSLNRGVPMMSIGLLAAMAFWLLAWSFVLIRWRSRRIKTDRAALLLATTSAASLGLYSILRHELTAVLTLVLIAWALVEFAVARYVLRVFAEDRPEPPRAAGR